MQAVLKDSGKLPQVLIEKEKETEAYKTVKEIIEKDYKAAVKIEEAETQVEDSTGPSRQKATWESKEQKARQAMPGKPAIIVK